MFRLFQILLVGCFLFSSCANDKGNQKSEQNGGEATLTGGGVNQSPVQQPVVVSPCYDKGCEPPIEPLPCDKDCAVEPPPVVQVPVCDSKVDCPVQQPLPCQSDCVVIEEPCNVKGDCVIQQPIPCHPDYECSDPWQEECYGKDCYYYEEERHDDTWRDVGCAIGGLFDIVDCRSDGIYIDIEIEVESHSEVDCYDCDGKGGLYIPRGQSIYHSEPFNLSFFAYRGQLAPYIDASYDRFCSKWGRTIKTEDVLYAGIALRRVDPYKVDGNYVHALEMQIDLNCRD